MKLVASLWAALLGAAFALASGPATAIPVIPSPSGPVAGPSFEITTVGERRFIRRGGGNFYRGGGNYYRGGMRYAGRNWSRGNGDWYGRRGYYSGGGRYYRRPGNWYWNRGYYDNYWYPGAAFLAGAIIVDALADDYPPERYGRAYVGDDHARWCYDRYRSYRISDDTFQPYDGPRRRCISPY